ncbi:MAG TPA: hypothetical protein VK662_09900, partial [Acidothermaceae bacterium]|nr:hypothetical protein [Acidothermaceae bacterium]
MSRGLGRILAAVAAAVALTGCSSSHSAEAGSSGVPSQEPAVSPVVSAPTFRSPTATQPPTPVLGSLTKQLPAGITSVKVTFLRGTRSVYQRTITDSATVRGIIREVDDSHED